MKPKTVEKISSSIGPSAGIEPMPLRCRCNAPTSACAKEAADLPEQA